MIVPNSQNRMAIATTEIKPVLHAPVIDRINLGNDKIEGTITTSSRAHYLLIVVANTDSQPETTEEQILNSIQIEKNSTPTAYEEYKSQTYPINLGTKNLFNLATYQQLVQNNDYYRGEYSFENDSLTITTTTNDSYIPKMSKTSDFEAHQDAVIEVKPNTTYTFSFETSGDIPYGKYYIYEGNASYQGVKTTINATFDNKKSIFTTGNTTKYIIIRFAIWESTTITFSRLQLEEGDIQHEYTKYGAQILELCQIDNYKDEIFKGTGKNLFDKDNANVLNALLSVGGGTLSTGNQERTLYIKCKPNTTYTISKAKGKRLRVDERSSIPTIGSANVNMQYSDEATNLTYTTSANGNYLLLNYLYTGGDTLTNEQMLATIQIEYGTTATPYEPYGKIWYLNKRIGKSILDGSENWIYSDTYQGIKQFNLLNSDTIYSNDSSVNIISNYYLGIGFSNSWTKDNSITIANPQQSGKRIRIMTSISSTVEDFKT